jgi:hypothetical protein
MIDYVGSLGTNEIVGWLIDQFQRDVQKCVKNMQQCVDITDQIEVGFAIAVSRREVVEDHSGGR